MDENQGQYGFSDKTFAANARKHTQHNDERSYAVAYRADCV